MWTEFYFSYMENQISQHHLLNFTIYWMSSFPHWLLITSWSFMLSYILRSVSGLLIMLYWPPVCPCIHEALLELLSFIIILNTSFFVFTIALVILGPSLFHINLRIDKSIIICQNLDKETYGLHFFFFSSPKARFLQALMHISKEWVLRQ